MRPLGYDDLLTCLIAVNAWDSQHGLILSTRSAVHLHRMREFLNELRTSKTLHEAAAPLSEAEKAQLDERIDSLELALRTDLGVYEVDALEQRSLAPDYPEANRTIMGREYEPFA